MMIIYKTTFFQKNILKWFLHGFSSNEHIVQKPLSEMYTSHFEYVRSSTFQQQQKQNKLHSKTHARRQNMGYLNNGQAQKQCNIIKLS
jgi:hypothetical protein